MSSGGGRLGAASDARSRVGARLRRRSARRAAFARSAVTRCGELLGVGERDVGRIVVVADPLEQRVEPLLPMLAALQVDELRDLGREVPLVLETRHLLARRDPAVLLPVDADEDVALLEVGAVQLARRMRPRAELEHHRRHRQPLDRRPRRSPLRRQLLQRRADEDPQALVGRPDDTGDPVHAASLRPRVGDCPARRRGCRKKRAARPAGDTLQRRVARKFLQAARVVRVPSRTARRTRTPDRVRRSPAPARHPPPRAIAAVRPSPRRFRRRDP